MVISAVSDTGPIIHLSEINLINAFDIFSEIIIPEEVKRELRNSKISLFKKIKILKISANSKDLVKFLTNRENLDFGEAFAIALAIQEKIKYFLTDDLDARNVAINYNFDVHGSIGIILRAFREKIIDKKIAIEKVIELHSKSSLFITNDLIKEVIQAIENYSER